MANNIQTIYNNRYTQGYNNGVVATKAVPMTITLHATYKAVTGDNGAYTTGGTQATIDCANFNYMDLQSLSIISYVGACVLVSGATYNIASCTSVVLSCSGVTNNGIHAGECVGIVTFRN